MNFEQWMTLSAVVVGPVGIAIGWGLSEWSDARKARDAGHSLQRLENRQRGLAIIAAGSAIGGEGRNLAHAVYQINGLQKKISDEQMHGSMGRFNRAMGELDRLILEADVLGPDGMAAIGRSLQDAGRNLTAILTNLQSHFLAEDVTKVQDETLPAFDAAVEEATGKSAAASA